MVTEIFGFIVKAPAVVIDNTIVVISSGDDPQIIGVLTITA
jgi:hypothetical protein